MGLTKTKLRDARKAIHHSVMVTLRAHGYFYDVKDHGHYYAVTAAWEHTAEGSRKKQVPQPQPQVAAAVPTDNLTEAGKITKQWWESKRGVLEAMGDKEATYNKVGYWLMVFIDKIGRKLDGCGNDQIRAGWNILSYADISHYPNGKPVHGWSPEKAKAEKIRGRRILCAGFLYEVDKVLDDQSRSDAVPTIGWVNQERFWFSDMIKHFLKTGELRNYDL
jgi:hypothetical protein